MYNFLKIRSTSLQNFPCLSSQGNGSLAAFKVTENVCNLCNKVNNGQRLFSRFQSTHTSPNVQTKKPRKKRNKCKKNYAEIVVVSDKAHSQTKAMVHKLRPDDLKMLALTNLNLSELHKLKEIHKNNQYVESYTYNNLSIIENIPVFNEYNVEIKPDPAIDSSDIAKSTLEVILPILSKNIPDLNPNNSCDISENAIKCQEADEAAILETEIVRVKPDDTFKPEVDIEEQVEVETEETFEEAKDPGKIPLKKPRYDYKLKEEITNRTLAAYMEVCVSTKQPYKGLNALYFHRHRQQRTPDFPKISYPEVYNALLKGFSSKGEYKKVDEILRLAKEDRIKLNVQTYLAIFECIGRSNNLDYYLKDLRIITKEAQANGITYDKIMNEGLFANDEREYVLKAMKHCNLRYEPKYNLPSVQYCNHLVDHLNHEDQHQVLDFITAECGTNFGKSHLNCAVHDQLEIEKTGYVTVKSIDAKTEPTPEILKYREALGEHFKYWEETANEAFNRDLNALVARRSPLNLEPYMRSIPVKDFIAIILDEAKKIAQGSETYSPTTNQLYRDMGMKVYARYKVLKKQKTGVLSKIMNVHTKYCYDFVNTNFDLEVLPTKEDNVNSRQKWQWTEYSLRPNEASIILDHQEWVPTILQAIGKFLYHIVMHDLKIDVNVMRLNKSKHKNYLPAFYTIFRHQGRITKEEVKPHPILSKLYRASVPETLTFPAYEVPMKCPPIPWISVHTGGYLISPCEVVRLPPSAASQKQRLNETSPNKMYPSLDALNQLASVPWKVNTKILDVILEVFNSGGSSKLDVPEPPSSLAPPPPVTQEMDKSQKFQIFRQRLQYRRKKGEMYSLWCDCLYRLSLANHFRSDIFWLPHNMDFRGRVYPIPPHLNHLGSDLARSMLVFAESRPLGPDGLNWLKLHLVNLTGLKKREPVHERLIFANDIMADILDSADNPLTGNKWWAQSEEPWQTLACCIEIANAHRSPNPEEYRTHFPVHQDGSCNGLQHYAALGRDSAGAYSVNLSPADIPQDVYSAVATLVEELRHKDALNGVEVAKVLDGFVKRKVIKQTVMTTVYGVTRYGARLQIARQLKDIDNFPKDFVWSASSYLTGKTFESLRSMFTSTREIQDWFTECARLISSVGGQNVEWITPLGFPIVQPYFRYKQLPFNQVYEHYHMDKFERPNVMKQKNAFPPNFIHSLDSTHMMLTSLHCERAGINFVSVHDCYWTHPSTVHIMNKVCREQFVALHLEPILENLSVFLTEKYSYSDSEFTDDGSVTDLTKRKLNRILKKLPNTGKFDINKVLDSVYFFS